MSTKGEREIAETANSESKPPFLRRISIRGYKSIEFCDVTLEPLTILVGRNASGKSNFLDALAFVRDAMETTIPEAVRRHGGWSSVLARTSTSKRVAFEVELGFICGRAAERVGAEFAALSALIAAPVPIIIPGMLLVAVYRFEIEAGPHGQPTLVRESLRFQEPDSLCESGFEVDRGHFAYRWVTPAAGSDDPSVLHRPRSLPIRSDRLLLSVLGTQPFVDVADGLRFMGFYNFNPESIRQLHKPDFGAMLDREGKNLASLIESVREIDEATTRRVNAYLRVVVPEVDHFAAVRLGEYMTVRFTLRSGEGISPLEFDAASMSDGTLRTVASLMAAFQIHLPSGPTVVGIEEPETALHPAAMRALVDALDEATLSTQVLLTTHSAEMLDNPTIRPENVRVVQMIDGRTVIGPVDEASAEIVRRKLDTLGGLERQNQLEPDLDDQDRQQRIARNGVEAAP